MKKIRIKQGPKADIEYHKEDVARIMRVFSARGYLCSAEVARDLWERYSEYFAASWLFLPVRDQDILECLRDMWEEDR